MCKGVKRVSYAASLGVDELSAKEIKQYKFFLEAFEGISIREESGKELIELFIKDKNIEWVCGPTLLLSIEHYKELQKRPECVKELNGEYIFCYFLGTNPEHRQKVYEYAKSQGLTILSIANFRGYCENDTLLTDIQLYDLTVNEFLYLIDNARLVCTDSMHATIFSIIFESDFWTFERFRKNDKDSRNTRIYSLLKIMELEDRLVDSNELSSNPIDYKRVRMRKDRFIESSKLYIEGIL